MKGSKWIGKKTVLRNCLTISPTQKQISGPPQQQTDLSSYHNHK